MHFDLTSVMLVKSECTISHYDITLLRNDTSNVIDFATAGSLGVEVGGYVRLRHGRSCK